VARAATPFPIDGSTTDGDPIEVSVVVPVLDAAEHLPQLFAALQAQRPRPPDEIVIIDSGSTDDTIRLAEAQPNVRLVSIESFTHGGARNLGARFARGRFVVFLSQDARPQGDDWLERLLSSFLDEGVVAAFSRQVPYASASPMERFFLQVWFPPGAPVRRDGSAGTDRLEKVFFSNVSAAYRRSALLDMPFDEGLIMAEDQDWARTALRGRGATVYRPDSAVLHSHDYDLSTVLRRYFDTAYAFSRIFPDHGLGNSMSLGLRYLAREVPHMCRRHPARLPYYAAYTTCKVMGVVLGHFAETLPVALVRKLSLHRDHWRRPAEPAASRPLSNTTGEAECA
jgi:rhamnosyltransferase